jgi:hypothetical protein
MKYSERTIPKTAGELRDAVTFVMAHAPDHGFPDWTGLDFDGGFERLFLGVENLRRRFGDTKADQLQDMLRQAKQHFNDGHALGGEQGQPGFLNIGWGCWLMQDVSEVIGDRPPFAYPEDLYRWPRPSIN